MTSARRFALLAAVFFLLVLPFVRQPVTQDLVFFLLAAEKLATGVDPYPAWPAAFAYWHPPLYVWLLAQVGRLAGNYVLAARLVGLACGLATLGLTLACARRLRPGPEGGRAAWWAGLLLVTSPMTIHGFLVPDIDTSILPVAILLVVYALLRAGALGTAAGAAGVGARVALAMCVKWTTPLVLPIAVALAAPGGGRRRAALGLLVGFGAAAAAVAAWTLYCGLTGAPFAAPFRHLSQSLVHLRPHGGAGAVLILRTILVLVTWTSPFLLILAALGSRRIPLWLAVVLWVPFLGYVVVGGLTYGFPKYHLPLIPLFALAGGVAVTEDGAGGRASFTGAAAVAGLTWFALGDPLYGLLWLMKIAAWRGASMLSAVCVPAAWLAVGGLGAAAVAWRRGRGDAARWAAAGTLAWGLALTVRQALAGYQTVYTYGGRGLEEAVVRVRGHAAPGSRALAPAEILYLAGDRHSPYDIGALWYDPHRLAREAADPAVRALVYGPSVNSLEQLRAIESQEPQAVLAAAYARRDVGDLVMWVRPRGGGR